MTRFKSEGVPTGAFASLDKPSEGPKEIEDALEDVSRDDGSQGPQRGMNEIELSYWNMSKPIRLTNFFVNKPRLWLFIVVLALVTISGVDVAMGWFTESQTSNRDYLIWDDHRTIDFDKTMLA